MTARTKPDAFDFPPHAALHNVMASLGYPMRLDRTGHHLETMGIGQVVPGSPDNSFYQVTTCRPYEAEMFVRPYLRPELDDPDIRKALSSATLTLRIDGEIVLDALPANDFAIGQDGYGWNPCPCSMPGSVPGSSLFRACRLQLLDGRTPPPDMDVHAPGYVCNIGVQYGLMLPNGSSIEIFIRGIHNRPEPLRLTIGVVSAIYTTRGLHDPEPRLLSRRKQDWSPRDTHYEAIKVQD